MPPFLHSYHYHVPSAMVSFLPETFLSSEKPYRQVIVLPFVDEETHLGRLGNREALREVRFKSMMSPSVRPL